MVGGAASRLLIDVYRYINTRFNALYSPIGLKAGMVYSGSKITLEILDPHLYRSDATELLGLSQSKSNENYSFLVNKEYLIMFKITYNNKSYYGLGTTLGVSFVSYTVGYVTVEDNGNGLLSSFQESSSSSSTHGLMSKLKSKIRVLKIVSSPNDNNENNQNNQNTTIAFDVLRRVI